MWIKVQGKVNNKETVWINVNSGARARLVDPDGSGGDAGQFHLERPGLPTLTLDADNPLPKTFIAWLNVNAK